MKYEIPILLDTNIILYFQKDLSILCNYFNELLIHEYVYKEVISEGIRQQIDNIIDKLRNVKIVNNDYIRKLNDIETKIYSLAKEELNATFNLKIEKDIGECETLLYAKFNRVQIISTQDTTVWSFAENALHFSTVKCMTIQDISLLIMLYSEDKKHKSIAKYLYNTYGTEQHNLTCFKKYSANINNELPCYLDFENDRILNFIKLINDYLEWAETLDTEKVKSIIGETANNNKNTCLSCLFSRMDKHEIKMSSLYSKQDKNNPVYKSRICARGYSINDMNCSKYKSEFDRVIKDRKDKVK